MNEPTYPKVFRDKIREHRGNYFVTYNPADGSEWLASISLSFPELNVDLVEVKGAMEWELKHWLNRFAVPLMVSAFDAKDSVIRFSEEPYESHLTGYVDPGSGKIAHRWGLFENGEFPSKQKDARYLARVYHSVPFRLQEDVREKVRREARNRGRVIWTIVFFYAGSAVLIEIVALGVEKLGHALATISIAVGLYKLGKTMGWLKLSKREKEKAEKERKMAHYFYHCERNPDGFNRLKVENFEREAIEHTRKESEDIRKQQKQ